MSYTQISGTVANVTATVLIFINGSLHNSIYKLMVGNY